MQTGAAGVNPRNASLIGLYAVVKGDPQEFTEHLIFQGWKQLNASQNRAVAVCF